MAKCNPNRSTCGMSQGIYNPFFQNGAPWYGSGGSGGGFPLSKIVIQYNNTDYSYMTDGGATFPDLTSFRTNSNVISVYKVSDNGNPNTGLSYDFVNDRVVVMEMQSTSSNGKAKFYNKDGTLASSVDLTGAHQGISVDPIGGRIFGYLGSSGNEIKVFNMSGVLQETIAVASGYQGGGCHYDWIEDKLYVTDTGSSPSDVQRVLVYQKISGTWTLIDTLWFVSAEGFYIDYIRDRYVLWEDTSYIQTYTRAGIPLISEQFNVAITSSNKEGIICDPTDGTIWQNIDDGFHSAVTNGNRVYRTDPQKLYKKFLRFPDMIPYDYFDLDSASIEGYYNNQVVTASSFIVSPVIDFVAHTMQQTESNWSVEEDHTIEYRGSDSAPSTTAITNTDYLSFYDANGTSQGWGSTTPGEWQSTIPTTRYVQFRIKPLETEDPAHVWTPLDLGSAVAFWYEFDAASTGATRLINASDDSLNYIRAFNKANPGTNDTNTETTDSVRPQWNTGTSAMRMGSRTWSISSPSTVLSQQQGELNVVGAKTAASTPGPMLIQYDAANAGDNQLSLEHLASTDGTANAIGAVITNGVESVINKMTSPADANLTFKLRTISSNGSTTSIFINKVSQTVTATTGTNTGQWFGDVSGTSLRFARRTATAGNVGAFDYRFVLETNRPLTTQERSDLYDYCVSKGFL